MESMNNDHADDVDTAGRGSMPAADESESAEPTTRTKGMGLTIAIALIGVVVLLGGIALLTGGDDSTVPDDLSVLDPSATADVDAGSMGVRDAVEVLPEFDLTEFGGDGVVAVQDFLGGQPLVLNFWATWCAPCVAEMPDFQRVHESAGDAFRLVGINTQDAAINAEPFVQELGITYDLAVDPQGEFFTMTGGFGMPTTLFVDPDGTVAFRHTGPLTIEQMTDLLAEHLDVTVDVASR